MMEIDPTIRLNALPKAKSGRKKRAKFNDEYEVERILDKRRGAKDSYEYLVQWRGYSAEDNTWEPAHNVANAAKAIADYEQRQKQQQSSVVTTDNVEAMQISSTESAL